MKLSADMADLSVLIGLVLIGLALFLAYGTVAALAYVGAVLVACGFIFALRGDNRK